MQSNNPVFRNSDEFNGRANAYGNQVYDGSGTATPGYGTTDPSTWSTGSPTHTDASNRRMTIDTVVQKTGLSIFIVIAGVMITASVFRLAGSSRRNRARCSSPSTW